MEVCAPGVKAISESTEANPAILSADSLKENRQSEIVNCFVSNLENSITEHLHIKDAHESEFMSNGDDAINNVKREECVNEKLEACSVRSSCQNSAEHTDSPCNDVKEDNSEVKPKVNSQETGYEDGQSYTLPIPLKLVSAMKGSREKHGSSLKKLNVTWAPDVYDPIPTSVSHSVTRGKNKQRLHSKRSNSKKKNGKNKQKGNTSRGSGSCSKDKKQSRKVSSAAYDRFMDSSDCYENFEAGSPDYCGSGFLMQSLSNVHYSTAEAL